jgi:hypothetical protein
MAVNKEEKDDVFKGLGRKINISSDDDFLKIKETLTRVGIVTEPSRLLQVCYILHKKGHYAIVHHKELLTLDNISIEVDEDDIKHRNIITDLLKQWNLLTVSEEYPKIDGLHGLKVVPYRDKSQWNFTSLYNIGRK